LGLTGVCDYIISKSTNQVYVSVPVVMIVEAKNENIKAGLPQCIAAMYAAKIYNEHEHNAVDRILGIVTTGSNWKFLTLEDTHVLIDWTKPLLRQLLTCPFHPLSLLPCTQSLDSVCRRGWDLPGPHGLGRSRRPS